jgi:hypothetical protein
MRLNIAMNSANETLIALINRGYAVLNEIGVNYSNSKAAGTYQEEQDNKRYADKINAWGTDAGQTHLNWPRPLTDNCCPTQL